MEIIIGNDHAGVDLKFKIIEHLKNKGFTVINVGTDSPDSVDYPDIAHAVAQKVAADKNVKGILLCGSGNGISIAANKHKDIRAALCWNTEIAELARLHNDANVLSLPARYLDEKSALAIVDTFLATSFEGGRHQRRVDKINC